ncbi:MAG: tetratricopeptide repeat protein [Acidobacteriota bacterium]
MSENEGLGLDRTLKKGIMAVEREDYTSGMELLSTVYTELSEGPADGLSHYGVCLSLLEKKHKPAIRLCQRAVDVQFYQPSHYVNFVKVYLAAGSRRKAVEILEQGMRRLPNDETILGLRQKIGYRRSPVIPFLHRDNPMNIAFGKMRSRRQSAEVEVTQDEKNSQKKIAFWVSISIVAIGYIAFTIWLFFNIVK